MDRKLSVLFQVVTFYGCGTRGVRQQDDMDRESARASFECQNWPREKGALPGVKGRMERCGKKSTPSLPPLPLKKGGGFGSTVVQTPERERECSIET